VVAWENNHWAAAGIAAGAVPSSLSIKRVFLKRLLTFLEADFNAFSDFKTSFQEGCLL
jgi:hypothetical protein